MENNSIHNDHGFIGTGTPYFYPEDGSAPFFFGNPVACKIKSSSDTKLRQSRRKQDAGAALDSKSTPKPAEVTISTDTFQPRTWAMALMGKSGKVTISVNMVTDEEAKVVLDGYHQLAHTDIDAKTVVVKKDGQPIDASKYDVQASMGLLQITDASVATAGETLTVSYKTVATTKTVIDGAKVTGFKGKLIIDGMNDVTGQPAKLIIPNITLAWR